MRVALLSVVSGTLLVLIAATALATAEPIPLVRDGKPAAAIVLSPEPSQSARFAAAELRYHIHRITGATLPIVTDASTVAGPRILVGESDATRALKLRGPSFRPQQYLIRFLPDTLVLIGNDEDDPRQPDLRPRIAPGRFGGAAQFDGASTLVRVPEAGFSDARGSWEAQVWMPAEAPEKHGTILRVDGANPWTYHILQRDAGTSRINYVIYDGQNSAAVRSEELAEGWHHVLATWDTAADSIALYVDGKLCGTGKCLKTTCAGAIVGIGGVAHGSTDPVGNCFIGLIDEVRISRVVRDPATDAAGGPYEMDEHTGTLYHFDSDAGLLPETLDPLAAADLPNAFRSCGTLYAVYDFLERHCGVRWYAPGEIGIVCPEQSTLAVSGSDRKHQPAMEMRMIAGAYLYMPTAADRVPGPAAALYKLRMRIGGAVRVTGHSFYHYPKQYQAEHPEWFARSAPDVLPSADGPPPPQMCYTSEGFIKQISDDATAYFDDGGTQGGAGRGHNVFGLVPMDNSTWCQCPACQALLNPAEKDNPQFNNGYASDYIYEFTNRVAREVGKRHPGKWLGQLAYSTYAYHPLNVKLEPNIQVQMCLHTRNWWCPSMEANDRKVLRDWREQEPDRPLYLWLYYCFPALNARSGNFHYFPGFFARQVVEQMRMYHDAGIRGMYIENSSECDATFLMDQLEYYVTFKLADDPTLDGNRLIEEFFTGYYGAAAEPMKALYCRIEDIFTNPKYYPPEIQGSAAHQHQTEELAWKWLGTPERMAQMQQLMDQAVAAARTDAEKQRVDMFKRGIFDYMVEGRRLYDEHNVKRAQPIATVNVPRVAAAGELRAPDDLARVDWARLADCPGWGGLSGDPAPRTLTTRLGHDGRYLLIECTDAVSTKSLRATDEVWTGDDFELFFAPARDATAYNQLCIGPSGGLAPFAWKTEPRGSGEWESGAIVMSDTSDAGRWTIRAAFPLDRLLPGASTPAGKLYANFYRNSPGNRDMLAWQPVFSSGFHDTARLPELVLEDGANATGSLGLPCLPGVLAQAFAGQEQPTDPGRVRERSEWSQIWWDVANDTSMPRVLLIGDSVTVGYSAGVIKQLEGIAHVDRLGNSRNILDPIHLKETRTLLEEGQYAVIHFNNGLHGFHLSVEQYAQGLRDYVALLRELAPGVPLIWGSSTPITVKEHPEQLAPNNDVVVARNAAAAEIMNELGILTNDLYALVVGKPELRSDTHHYNEVGRAEQAEAVAGALRPYVQP